MKGKLICSFALALLLGVGSLGAVGMPQALAQDTSEQPVQMRGAVASLDVQDVAQKAASASTVKVASAKKTSKVKPAKPTKKQLKEFKKASANFAIDLFKRSVMAKGKNANVTVAPMSVMSALSLTANGARGKTLTQMRKVLGNGASMARINKNLAWYNSRLANAKKARLRSANSVWYHNDGSLKMKKGFLNKARNYYAAEVNDPDDNPPIGIILCTDKDSVTAEYAWGGLSNNIFASRYVLYMPNKEQLIRQVETVLEKWNKVEE